MNTGHAAALWFESIAALLRRGTSEAEIETYLDVLNKEYKRQTNLDPCTPP
jgi:hypothetical protein